MTSIHLDNLLQILYGLEAAMKTVREAITSTHIRLALEEEPNTKDYIQFNDTKVRLKGGVRRGIQTCPDVYECEYTPITVDRAIALDLQCPATVKVCLTGREETFMYTSGADKPFIQLGRYSLTIDTSDGTLVELEYEETE